MCCQTTYWQARRQRLRQQAQRYITSDNPCHVTHALSLTLRFLSQCLALKCDVTKEDQIEHAVAATVQQFGRLDYAAYVNQPTDCHTQTDSNGSAMRQV
jgi:NAD(P)-dependent dehydrogenase (short-subunit alcohol dehydrogenase family)